MNRFDWSRLNHLQLGRYAEYLAKMEVTLYGHYFYTAEVDDKGIDFVVRAGEDRYFDDQVKSLRPPGYVFLRKDKFPVRANNLLALALMPTGEAPRIHLIPATVWMHPEPPIVSRDNEGLKSAPEWGINVSASSMKALETYKFEQMVPLL